VNAAARRIAMSVKLKPRRNPLRPPSNGKKNLKSSSEFTISRNPATLQEIGRTRHTDLARFPEIFASARAAQAHWKETSFDERKKHIMKMRRYILDHADELAQIVSSENGKSRVDALATEVIPCAMAATWYAKKAKSHLKPKKLSASSLLFFNKKNMLIRVPLGVVGIISPWNYPLSIPFGEVVMGLMAGNAILLKTAAVTTLVGKAIEKIVEAGELPAGLFHLIVGSGSAVSRGFFENKIDKIFFTGSVPTGKTLMAEAAKTLTPLSLELGGKDPMIILEDADLERAANGAAWAGYQNAGQSCGGIERIYVQETVYDRFLSLLADKTISIRHGADSDFNVDMGSMTTADQLETVSRQVSAAVKSGAKIVAQSHAAANQKGYFYPATLMTDVNHSMELMREETFGPVLPVMKFHTIEDAVRMANDSSMALTSSIWTKDVSRGRKIAERIEAGVTTINDHLYTHGQSETPWGGWKDSGLGRTHSELGLHEMTHPKLVNWDTLPFAKRNIWWYPFSKNTYAALKAALYFNYPRSIGEFFRSVLTLSGYAGKKIVTPWKTKK